MEKDKTKNQLIITRIFNAPREKVWQAWIDPDMIKKWWGPKYFTAPYAAVDFKVGGKYLYSMRGQAGPDAPVRDYWSGGVFQEIIPLKKIVVTDYFTDEKGNQVSSAYYGMSANSPLEMEVIITLEDLDGKTKFTLYYPDRGSMPVADREGMEQGWNQSLDKLAESLK